MNNDFAPPPRGPGRLLGAISLLCLTAFLVVGGLTAVMLSNEIADGGGGTMIRSGVILLLAIVVGVLICLVGMVFGLAGVLLAVNHPQGKPLLPAVGLGMNALPLLALAFLRFFPHIW